MEYRDVAERFVDLVSGTDWSEVEVLSPEQEAIFREVLSTAGFEEVVEIVVGKLHGQYSDGGEYLINEFCPVRVNRKDEGHRFGTGWLDCLFSVAGRRRQDREEVILAVATEIERSIPLTPIQLTVEGDFLVEGPLGPLGLLAPYRYFVDHTDDDKRFNGFAGAHKYCRGYLDRKRATEDKDVVCCRSCGLRVYIPREVKSYGDLRRVLASRFQAETD